MRGVTLDDVIQDVALSCDKLENIYEQPHLYSGTARCMVRVHMQGGVRVYPPWMVTNLLTYLLTYLPTYLLTYSLTHLLTYLLTCLLTYLLTHGLTD